MNQAGQFSLATEEESSQKPAGTLRMRPVEPMTSVTPMRLKRREDVVTDGDRQGDVLRNAPDAREGFFAVPKVVE